MDARVGHGYDVHRFKKGRKFILGGVEIPYEYGLLGHSDADCLCHALMDALLGAAGLNDIGYHFPPDDPKYLDIDSLYLLKQVRDMIVKAGFIPVNVDSTIICETPKLSRFIPRMRENIADILELNLNCVSIKATTEEGLGFTGSKKALAAHAVCLIKKL